MSKQLHPMAVEFDTMECCAMERARRQEAHQSFINGYLASVRMNDLKYGVSVLLGIFQHTLHLVFIPTDVHRTLYAELARMEKAALEKPEDEKFECGHMASEHWKALDAVWVKMQPQILYN